MKPAFGCSLLGFAALALAACSNEEPQSTETEPSLIPAVDENPDPNIVEIQLEAKESVVTYGSFPPTNVWGYNGMVPGPLIEARVGQRLIVHFKNSLPEPTTIHWHGVRLPAAMDGSLAMQSPIEPGETFRYEFTLKDAGLFWYHPHVGSDVQIEKGLYGAMRVRGPNEPEVDEEKILVLDDIGLNEDGSIPEELDDLSKMMGRGGDLILVNGQADAALYVRPGAAVRLRIVNTANGRFFSLRLPGVTWRVIGTDGGLLSEPYETDRLLISPGERYDVVWIADGGPGTHAKLMSDPFERGHGSGDDLPIEVATVRFQGEPIPSPRALPTAFPEVERFPDGPVDFPVVLDEGVNEGGDLVFTINGAAFPHVPMIAAPNGSMRIFEVKNESDMDHPFHLHGFFFQVLDRGGLHTENDGWEHIGNKDTMIVRAKSSVRLAARLDEPGMWMYHCHINEHSAHGMMGELHVE